MPPALIISLILANQMRNGVSYSGTLHDACTCDEAHTTFRVAAELRELAQQLGRGHSFAAFSAASVYVTDAD